MKNISIAVLLLSITFSYSQDEGFKFASVIGNFNYPVAVGNNFLNKGYSNAFGYDLSLQLNPTRHFFFGLKYRKSNEKIIDADLIGYFSNSSSNGVYYYIGYRHNLIIKKLYLEHFIGYGNKDITNKSLLSDYVIRSDNSYLIGSRFNYAFTSDFSAFFSIDYNYTNYKIDLSGPYRDFYTVSKQFTPAIGLKVSFGDVGLKKKPKQQLQ